MAFTKPLRDDVTVEGVRAHLQEFQRISDENDGNRAAGTPGYVASAEYVHDALAAAGYEVGYQEFEFPYWRELEPSILELVDPQTRRFENGKDFRALIYSKSGEVTAEVQAIGYDPEAESGFGAGCSASDFSGLEDGNVALVQPGPCFRRDQVLNAQRGGASAIIISYPEFGPDRPPRRPTLFSPDGINIPAFVATGEVGDLLASRARVHLRTEISIKRRTTTNVIADSRAPRTDKVVMLGGHLDSVVDGPGINDNGSGVAVLLEVALRLADDPLKHRVRFAFWGAEELALIGSTRYVEQLSQRDRDRIVAYLNFDMVASRNYAMKIYEGASAPAGSNGVETLFVDYFKSQGVPKNVEELAGASDDVPFLEAGIAIGGIYTGSEEIKTSEEAAKFGGQAGKPLDRCYHVSCDTIENINDFALKVVSDAVAHVALVLGTTLEPLAA